MGPTLTREFEIELKQLLEAINRKYGYDFRHYSQVSMKRRVIQAISQMKCLNLVVLQEKVLQNSECFYDLLQLLTIPVTEMFRDPSYFLAIRERVIPILKTYPSLKIWVAGCSTGEEVYSLAILLQEEELLERAILYAADINQRSLQKSGGSGSLSGYYSADSDSVKFKGDLKKYHLRES